jgi:hypothetical protein
VIGDKSLAVLPVSAATEVATGPPETNRRLAASGEGRSAELEYDRVLAIDPGNVPALIGRGYVRSWAGRYEEARRDFLAAMRTDTARAAALTGLGYTAARAGDYAAAADQFRQALRIAPTRADAATGLAYAELWRRDPRQAAHRAQTMSTPRPATYSVEAASQFRTAIDRLVERKFPDAERALSATVAAAPVWPEAYYNRALAYQAEERWDRAISDLQRYLQLRPTARNRTEVAERIEALRRTSGQALARGLILPGLGQLYTRRPALGAVVLAGVAGSTTWALTKRRTTEMHTFTDPFGKVDTFFVTLEKRPHAATGMAVAGVIWLLGAIEASLYADRVRSNVPLPEEGSRASRASARRAQRFRLEPVISPEPFASTLGARVIIPFR